MIYYFAYGSNLHPVRLTQRVPSAELVGVATHTHHRLSFHKKSHDGSGKCTMHASGFEHDVIHGAIYTLSPEHKHDLDRFEGKGNGYRDSHISLQHGGRNYSCFTYFAEQSHIVDALRPYHWYKQLVILGARHLNFPDAYIASIEAIESTDDPDRRRKNEHERLIEKIVNYR